MTHSVAIDGWSLPIWPEMTISPWRPDSDRVEGGRQGIMRAPMPPTQPPLSIVIPAYNEATRIVLTLRRIGDYLAVHHPDAELLVVDDGSRDDTALLVEALRSQIPQLRLLRQPRNRGKGAAVRRGMLEARGAWRLFSDADLSTPIEEVEKLLAYGHQGAPIVIGSRGLSQSDIRTRQPLARELMGRSFNVLVQALAVPGIRDTQCGFKLFRADVAAELFGAQTLDGFAFDVEVLQLAHEAGYPIAEVPVVWAHAPNSKVNPVTDSARMFRDLVELRARRIRARLGF